MYFGFIGNMFVPVDVHYYRISSQCHFSCDNDNIRVFREHNPAPHHAGKCDRCTGGKVTNGVLEQNRHGNKKAGSNQGRDRPP